MLSLRSLTALVALLALALVACSLAPAQASSLAAVQAEAAELADQLASFQAQLSDMDAADESLVEADAELETHAETEAETEADAELDNQADLDAEAEAELDAEAEAELGADSEADADADADADAEGAWPWSNNVKKPATPAAPAAPPAPVVVSGPAVPPSPAPKLNPNGVDFYSYRSCQKCVAHVLVYVKGQYIGSFYGNQNPRGYTDDQDTDMAPSYTIIPAGTYSIIAKPQSQYSPGDSFLAGNPSVAAPSGVAGVTRAGVRNIRMHPYGGSTGCQTAPLEWSNKIWDLIEQFPTATKLHIMYNVQNPPAVKNEDPRSKCHSYPVFGISC